VHGHDHGGDHVDDHRHVDEPRFVTRATRSRCDDGRVVPQRLLVTSREASGLF
jgi:hypothetical protein